MMIHYFSAKDIAIYIFFANFASKTTMNQEL